MVVNQGAYFTKPCQDTEEIAAALTYTVPDSPMKDLLAALYVLLPSAKVLKYLMVRRHWPVGQTCPFSYIFIHSFRSLCYDLSIASSKANSPQSAIYFFRFQFPVAAYVLFLVFPSLISFSLSFLQSRALENSSYAIYGQSS